MNTQALATLFETGGRLISGLLQIRRPSSPAPKVEIQDEPGRVSTAETLQYQRREIAKELTLLEGHLQQGCKINEKACDCCLVPGTKIYGNPRPVMIEASPYQVITHTGKFKPVTERYERHFEGELTELRVGYTTFPLYLTPEHPVLVAQNVRRRQRDIWRKAGISEEVLQWLPAGQLTDRDFMVFPRIRETKDRVDISLEMAELLGWYVAEGSMGGNRVTFSLGKDEGANVIRVKQLVKLSFGVEAQCYEKPTTFQICYSHKARARIFREFGTHARHKRLPLWFLYLPCEKQTAFLKAAIAGDGSEHNSQYTYTTTSETLIYQLRLVLFRLGILHTLSCRSINSTFIKGREIVPTGPRYDIHIAGEGAQILGFHPGGRKAGAHGWVGDNYVFMPVMKNGSLFYVGKVYNIAVEDDDSYLTAHGAIHNCSKHPMKIEALAQEAAGMTPEPLFKHLANWAQEIAPITTEAAASSGKYENEYPKLAIRAREFRKNLMVGLDKGGGDEKTVAQE